MLSRADLEKELAELDEREFYIQMNDHWSASDYDAVRKINARQREIEHLLETINEEKQETA